MLESIDRSGQAGAAAPERIRVLLVDDHGVVRRGLRAFFDLQPTTSTSSARPRTAARAWRWPAGSRPTWS